MNKLKTILVNDYEIAYTESGKGIPLVLVHGSLGDYRSLEITADFFSKRYRTIVLSLPHSYPELWNGEGDGVSILQHADDLAAFVKKISPGPVHILGHSRGGAVVLKTIFAHPKLFYSAVLADPAPFNTLLGTESSVMDAMNKRAAVVKKAVDLMQQGELDKGLEMFSDSMTIPGAWKKLPEAVRQIRRDNAWSLKGLIKDARVSFTCKDAKNIDIPILLVTGENSPRIYGLMHAALENCLKNHQKAIVPNASHGMYNDNPRKFNTFVMAFLNHNIPLF